ncbi:MAG: molecular chaperone DnaJ [Rhodospirillaceae bacterium]|nr:molecular chaperone DnaJ [Rhodospirillaceae bacterium]|tara:strand:- start:1302 stop:2249 length:948 start_codon:yes stop_codon:yes gene_type:complete
MDDPYKILGVKRSANARDIKAAYRRLAKKYHPDLKSGNADRFKNITGAYDILSDSSKKEKYDRGELDPTTGRERAGPGFWTNWSNSSKAGQGHPFTFDDFGGSGDDIFSSFFRQARQGTNAAGWSSTRAGRTATQKQVKNTNYKLRVPFIEATLGIKKRVTLSDGKVVNMTIPSGTETGTKLRLKGQGRLIEDKGETGDAVIEITVEDHEYFSRNGQDIFIDLPISLWEAVKGASILVPTIYGNVTLKIPENSNTGSVLRLKGKGVPKSRNHQLGDQYISLQIMLPEQVDEELNKFIETWVTTNRYNPREKMKIT